MDRSSRTLILALVLILYVLLAGLYALETPKWQAPDEPAHFNYVRAIADTGTLPILQPGDYNQDYLEEIKSRNFPPDMSIDPIRYESWQPPLYYIAAVPLYLATRAGGVDAQVFALRMFSVLLEVIVLLIAFTIIREIFPDSPLLPLATVGAMATIPMHLAVTASISNDTAAEFLVALMLWLAILRLKNQVTSRRFVILGGLLFGAGLLTKSTTWITGATVLIAAELGAWMLLGDQAGADSASRRLSKRKGGALLVPLGQQTLTEVDSSSADSAYSDREPLASSPRRPPTKGNGGKTGEGTEIKVATPVSVVISPAKRNPLSAVTDRPWRSPVFHLIALFAIAAVLSSPMFLRNVLTYGITDPFVATRHESVVVGQPTTAEMIAQLGVQRAAQNFVAITFRSFWGQFGWMGVLIDERIYFALFALTAVALLGLALYAYRLVRARAWLDDMTRGCLGVMALLVVSAIIAYLGYNVQFFQAQGRYLFPALIPIALFFVLGLREILAKEHARFLFALLYILMVGLDIAALFLYIVPQLTT